MNRQQLGSLLFYGFFSAVIITGSVGIYFLVTGIITKSERSFEEFKLKMATQRWDVQAGDTRYLNVSNLRIFNSYVEFTTEDGSIITLISNNIKIVKRKDPNEANQLEK